MREPITIFKGTTGLNTVDDPVRIEPTDLQSAVNITIERSGRVRTRNGLTELQTGAYHSLFCAGKDCFVVSGDSLYQVATDGSLTGIRSGLADRRMDFTQVGDLTYYVNGIDKGYVKAGVSYVWSKGTYTGPESTRFFTGPPDGDHIEALAGRMFVSKDNVLWFSELFNFDLFDQAQGFVQYQTKVLFIQAVRTGLYVSTENSIYFLAFQDGVLMSRMVLPYPGIEWTNTKTDLTPADVGIESSGALAAWASREGAVIGTGDGVAININRKKIIYPESAKGGFGAMVGYNFIHGLE
jgi:hypothetical protein